MPPRKPDAGFIDGETGVRIQYLVAGLHQRQHGEEHDGLAAGHHHHLVGTGRHIPLGRVIFGNGLAEFRNALGGSIAGAAVLHGPVGRLDDIVRGGKIGLADLQVDHFLPLGFQLIGLFQHLKGGFCPQPAHTAGKHLLHIHSISLSFSFFRPALRPGIFSLYGQARLQTSFFFPVFGEKSKISHTIYCASCCHLSPISCERLQKAPGKFTASVALAKNLFQPRKWY